MRILLIFLALSHLGYSEKVDAHDKAAVPYRSREMMSHEAAGYFLRTLGCKKKNAKDGTLTWDTDIFVWDVGRRLQRGDFSLEDFISHLNQNFEKDYAFKDSLTELAPFDKSARPENSTNLNVYKKDRDAFLNNIRELLAPFEAERSKESVAFNVPQAYSRSYADYKARIKKLEEWKNKFPHKMEQLCPIAYTRPDDYSEAYRNSVHTKKLLDKHSPPLDILARRYVNSLGCENFVSQMPLWFVGERIRRGEFSLDEWKGALNKELDATIENDTLEEDLKDHIVGETNKFLTHFVPAHSTITPQSRAYIPSTDDPISKNYRDIRQGEINFTNWLAKQRVVEKEKLPCDSSYTFEKADLHKRAGEHFDKTLAGQTQESSFCVAQQENLDQKYQRDFDKLRGQLETVFYGSQLNRYDEDHPYSAKNKMNKHYDEFQHLHHQATGGVLDSAPESIQSVVAKYPTHLKQVMAHAKNGEDRLPDILFQQHIEQVTKLWTSNFYMKDGDPTKEDQMKEFDKQVEALKKKHALQMVLACLEADGRLYFSSTHENEGVSTGFYPIRDTSDGRSDMEVALDIAANREKLESKNKDSHHFDEETNWGGAQISFNQVAQSNPSGRFYYSEISRILGVTKAETKINTAAVEKRIAQECKLAQLFKHRPDVASEIRSATSQLMSSMLRSMHGYQYSYVSWQSLPEAERYQAIKDFGLIQTFCPTLHLGLAEKVYINNPRYYGSLRSSKDRVDICSNVGSVTNPSSPALDDLTKGIVATLKQNHPKVNPAAPMASAQSQMKDVVKDWHHFSQIDQENQKADQMFEEIKSEPEIKDYFEQMSGAKLQEAWKMFTIGERPLRGWNDDFSSDTAQKLREVQVAYVEADPSNAKDFAEKKAAFFESQKERRSRSLWEFNSWVYRNKQKFSHRNQSEFESAMHHARDRFEALHDMYDRYERELMDQLRTCKKSYPTDSGFPASFPRYSPPVLIKAIPIKAPNGTKTKTLPKVQPKKK